MVNESENTKPLCRQILHQLKERFWVSSVSTSADSKTHNIKKPAWGGISTSASTANIADSGKPSEIGQLESKLGDAENSLDSEKSASNDELLDSQRTTKFEEVKNLDDFREKDSNSREVPFKLTKRHIVCFCVLMFAFAVTALDYSATGNVMATIAYDLHGSTSETEWIGNGYSLAACVFQLPMSALSDIFGRRAMFITSLLLFSIGSLVCATAHTMNAVIAGRVIQGAGGGGLLVLPEIVLADTVPLRQRSVYYGIFGLVWCISSGVAPMIAGALAQYSTWRWFFYMNLFITVPALVAAPFAIKLKQHDKHWLEKLKTVDYGGAILTIASTTSLLLALSWGGTSPSRPWSNYSVIVPLILGSVGFIITGFYEYWMKPEVPMFNFRVFANFSASICYLHNVLQGVVNMATIYFMPTFFQGAKGYGQLISGACILPLNLIGPPITLLFTFLIEFTGHYHFLNVIMWGLATVGIGLLVLYDSHKSLAGLILLQIPVSIGISCLYTTLSITANATNPPHLFTESTAMMSFCRSIGDALGTSIGGAVVASQLKSRLDDLIKQGYEVSDTTSVLSIVDNMHEFKDVKTHNAVLDVLSKSMQTLFIVLTAFCAFGFVLTFFQKEYSLDIAHEAKQGIKDKKKKVKPSDE